LSLTTDIPEDVGSTTVDVDTAEVVALSLIAETSANTEDDDGAIVELFAELCPKLVTCELTNPVELNAAVVEEAAVSLMVEEPRARLLIPVLEEDPVEEPELMAAELCAELEKTLEDKDDGALDWIALDPEELAEDATTEEDNGTLEETPELADEDSGTLDPDAAKDNCTLEDTDDTGSWDDDTTAEEDAS
jgi:hypothetical protein